MLHPCWDNQMFFDRRSILFILIVILKIQEVMSWSNIKTDHCLQQVCPRLQPCLNKCKIRHDLKNPSIPPEKMIDWKHPGNGIASQLKCHGDYCNEQEPWGQNRRKKKQSTGLTRVGDMMLTKPQLLTLRNDSKGSSFRRNNFLRSGLEKKTMYWPKGIVPVEFNKLSKKMERKLSEAMRDINYLLQGCILLRKATEEDKHVLKAKESDKCTCTVGVLDSKDGSQLNLADNCAGTHHELIHCIGFMHEFQRPDRDEYLKVKLNNIEEDLRPNFKIQEGYGRIYGTKLNYYSVMMYPLQDGKMSAKDEDVHEDAVALTTLPTRSDLVRVRRMYKCEEPELPKDCPWEINLDICIKVGDSEDSLTWEKAVQECRKKQKDSRLYEPWDITSYITLFERLKEKHGSDMKYWVGAKKAKDDLRGTYASNKLGMAFPDCFNANKGKYTCSKKEMAKVLCYAVDTSVEKVSMSIKSFECKKKLPFICEIAEHFTREASGAEDPESEEIQESTEAEKEEKEEAQEEEEEEEEEESGQDIVNEEDA